MRKITKVITLILLCIMAMAALSSCKTKTYKINFAEMKNGKIIVESDKYEAGASVKLFPRPDAGYELVENSLKANGKAIETTFVMPKENLEISAEFRQKRIEHTIEIATYEFGSIHSEKSKAKVGETINLAIKIVKDCQLKKDSLRFNNHVLPVVNDGIEVLSSFVMPDENVKITADFRKLNDDSTFEIGVYPQTVASFEAVEKMSAEPNGNGYYTSSYDNMLYEKVVAKPYSNGAAFDDSTKIEKGKAYFFQIEPIVWKVLLASNGERYATSKVLLDNQEFLSRVNINQREDGEYYNSKTGSPNNTFANNWQYSDLRQWLNGSFLTKAFSTTEQEKILTKSQSNGGDVSFAKQDEKGNLLPNKYAEVQNATTDKMLMLSFLDANKSDYNLDSKAKRLVKASDYARARGIYFSVTTGNGCYWLRTAGGSSYIVSQINLDGAIANETIILSGHLASSAFGIRPSFWLNLG